MRLWRIIHNDYEGAPSMNAQLLNDIVSAFVAALEAGTVTLGQYSFGLLAIAATLAFYLQIVPQVASGGTGVGEALAGFLLLLLKIGTFYWLLLHLPRSEEHTSELQSLAY